MENTIAEFAKNYPTAQDKDKYLIKNFNSILELIDAGVNYLIIFYEKSTEFDISRPLHLYMKELS